MVYYLDMPTELEPRYSLTELADLAGVTPRTVRYYISQGLLAVEAAPGPGPKYDDGHLARLRLIRRLQREHQPLAEIRRQLDTVDDSTILALAESDEPRITPPDSALDYIRRLTGGPTTHRIAEAPVSALYARQSMEAPVVGSVIPASAPAHEPAPAAPASSKLERSQWERIELAPDIELHIRRPSSRATAKRVDRLIAIARDLFREDPT
jgi:DNA-binding transcriptional MerR regulator